MGSGYQSQKMGWNLTETPSTVTCCSSITSKEQTGCGDSAVNFIRKQNVGKYWTREIFKFATFRFHMWVPVMSDGSKSGNIVAGVETVHQLNVPVILPAGFCPHQGHLRLLIPASSATNTKRIASASNKRQINVLSQLFNSFSG